MWAFFRWACDHSVQGAQHQPCHGALPFVQVGQRAHEGEEVVVPEDSDRHVLGAVGPEGHRPRLLVLGQALGVVFGENLLYLRLGVAGGDLAAHQSRLRDGGLSTDDVYKTT